MTQPDEPHVVTDTAHEDAPLTRGRPVVLVPTPPGLWMVLLGVFVATLSPLFGFLWGGTFGTGEEGQTLSPIYIGLFLGVLVGALGVIAALLGGVKLYRYNQSVRTADEDEAQGSREIA
ncbi:MAG: hypothetical protein Q4P07_04365 [Ornithinimicrobium sp.]|uniref:hypothetical protein n=1 Tax=Ornithinimicrobium sp. TaxID=1977084 RepID=UPI0026DF3CD4|nr:hypothetical protein [Ornithinimicrobium sp.]MDO5739365.1 hypothetical protein [Ornithinimicrobium sp.]